MLSQYCAEMLNRASVNQVVTRVSGVLMHALALAGSAVSIILVIFGSNTRAAAQMPPVATPDARGATTAAPQNTARALRGGGASQVGANGAPIILEANKGTLIRLTAPAATVFIANPDIADVQVKSPSLIYLSAKSPGETVIYAVDASDSVLLNSPVRVEHDVSRLRSSLRELAPGERISAESVDGNLVLSGIVSDASKADKVRALAAAIAGEAKGSQVINKMTVATPNQVTLHVRIAEVSLNILTQIGVDWHKFGTSAAIGTTVNGPGLSFNTTNNPTPILNSLIVGTFPSLFGQQVSATLDALATEGFIKDLAEPDLVALNGQTASFLAGGEFPVPVAGSSSPQTGSRQLRSSSKALA